MMCLNFLGSPYNLLILSGMLILFRKNLVRCNPITNSNFNEHIREFSLKEDNISSVNIKTMQKEDPKRHADLLPFIPIRYKAPAGENITSSLHILDNLSKRKRESVSVTNNFPDSKASGSSHSRDLISRDHPGYGPNEYEEYPHVSYDYHNPEIDHQHGDHHLIDHYGYHKGPHDYGYRQKHYNHELAAKAVLWPLAGIALLGAAAALVGNPILLQLGVATGKRKRRDTEEVTGSDIIEDNWSIPEEEEHKSKIKRVRPTRRLKTKLLKKKNNSTSHLLSKTHLTTHSPINIFGPPSTEYDDMVQIPIKLKDDYVE